MFVLVQHHQYSMTEVDNLIPFERDLYLEMLKEHIKKQEELAKNGSNSIA